MLLGCNCVKVSSAGKPEINAAYFSLLRLFVLLRSHTAATGRACAAIILASLLGIVDLFMRRHILAGNGATSASIAREAIAGGIADDWRIRLLHVAARLGVEVSFLPGAINAAFIRI